MKLKPLSFSFKLPEPVKTAEGKTAVRLEDGSGRYMCLFGFIPGIRPKDSEFAASYSFGEAAAEMLDALQRIRPDSLPAYRPYYELRSSYPLCGLDEVRRFCEQPPSAFSDLLAALERLKNAYEELSRQLDSLRSLPHQFIHGDMNLSNLLVDELRPTRITAFLDFEFCTWDVRAMEPAVILSDLLGKSGKQVLITQFCQGFGSSLKLSETEIEVIPLLMRLRKVDVFLHFMSRWLEGIDKADVLRSQVMTLSTEMNQLEAEETWIREVLRQYMMTQPA